MSQIINVPILFNNVDEQRLTHPNQLTVHAWNDIINTKRTQANAVAMYLKRLDYWFLDESNPDSWYSRIESRFENIYSAIDDLQARMVQEESELDNEIFIGSLEPTTENYRVWIDDDDPGQNNNNNMLATE